VTQGATRVSYCKWRCSSLHKSRRNKDGVIWVSCCQLLFREPPLAPRHAQCSRATLLPYRYYFWSMLHICRASGDVVPNLMLGSDNDRESWQHPKSKVRDVVKRFSTKHATRWIFSSCPPLASSHIALDHPA